MSPLNYPLDVAAPGERFRRDQERMARMARLANPDWVIYDIEGVHYRPESPTFRARRGGSPYQGRK